MTIDPLIVDIYTLDKKCDWATYIAAGAPWHGAIFKISQGLKFQYAAWAHLQRELFVASPRFGVDLFDGFYHYLDFGADGIAQAERAWTMVTFAGGELVGTLPLMIDAERGGQPAELQLTKTLVEHVIGAAAERYQQLSGRQATLYGGELLRSVGVSGLLGCGRSAVALYGPELHGTGESTEQFLERTGTDLAHLELWQYQGAGSPTGPAGYPNNAPGCGVVDISAAVHGLDSIRGLCSHTVIA